MTIDVKKQFNLSVKNNQRHSGCDIKRGGGVGGEISDLTKGLPVVSIQVSSFEV